MIVMCLVGYPLLVMEIGIGQKLRRDGITIWTTINPQLGGIGIVMCVVTVAMSCYYGAVLTWGTKYMVDTNKVRFVYPWSTFIDTTRTYLSFLNVCRIRNVDNTSF